jgi:hypothetical protein
MCIYIHILDSMTYFISLHYSDIRCIIDIYIYICIHIRIPIYIHTHMYIYIYTHIFQTYYTCIDYIFTII